MNYQDLVTETRYIVGDPQGTTYSTNHYSEAIEFAIKDYAKKTGATYLEVSAAADADGFVVVPADSLKVNRVLL